MDTLTFLGEGGNPAFIHERYIDGGAYGEVHEVLFTDAAGSNTSSIAILGDDSRFARKVIRAFGGPRKRKEIEDMIRNESRVIAKLCGPRTHPNIVVVLRQGSVKDTGMFYFDMEYCGENLGDFIHDSRPNGKCYAACSIMRDIAAGVAFIHNQGEVHRDLKPRNILYSAARRCWKIADFGLTSEGSSKLLHTTTGARGTDCYRAPELLQYPKATYNNKVDIWSMGCIMYEIKFKQKLFNSDWEVLKYSESSDPIQLPTAIEGCAETDLALQLAWMSEMLSLDSSGRPAARSLTERFSGMLVPEFPRILSLDDGGIRGLTSLFILRTIMAEIRSQTKATETPLPCQYFDLIGGSGTGGLIAIMLGRLRMSVDVCIKEYSDLSSSVFDFSQMLKGNIPPGDDALRFDYNKLETALKAVVKRKLNREDAVMTDRSTGTARTFVLFKHGTPLHCVPILCRSYLCDGNNPNMWSIWQAGRATTAAPKHFKLIESKVPPLGDTFGAPGVGYSNPGEIALTEASRIWTGIKRSCLVSIGTGNAGKSPGLYGQAASFNEPMWLPSVTTTGQARGLAAAREIAQHCGDLAQASVATHYRLFQSAISKDPRFSYYRFNLQGKLNLED